MRSLAVTSALLWASSASGATLEEVCRAITTLTPGVSRDTAQAYTSSIVKYSKQYKVDWRVSVAIFKQESNFDHRVVNWKSHDYGIGQMNAKTIQSRDIDLGQLLTDHDYAIEQTFRMLKELQDKYGKIDSRKDLRWFTRYHSFTPSIRAIYRKLLDKHLASIEALERVEKRRRFSSTATEVPQGVDPGDPSGVCDFPSSNQGSS